MFGLFLLKEQEAFIQFGGERAVRWSMGQLLCTQVTRRLHVFDFFQALNQRFTTSVDIDITMNTNRPCFIRVILKSGKFLLDKRICDLFYFGVLHVPEKVDIYI